MCLGESTTMGQYPSFLEKALNQSNLGIHFSVIDKGVGGTTTGAILSELEANLHKYRPNMVVVMMGVNDAGRHMPVETASVSKPVMILRSFKVYNLVRFLCLRLETKWKEMGFCIQRLNRSKDGPQGIVRGASYEALGRLYKDQGKFPESERALMKAVEINPHNDSAYVELGILYGWWRGSQYKLGGQEEVFKKAIELNPYNDSAYAILGTVYIQSGKPDEAEQILKKAIAFNQKNFFSCLTLGRLYLNQAKFFEAEQIFKKALESSSDDKRAFGELAALYSEMGNQKLCDIYSEKADKSIYAYKNPVTANNYRKLKKVLDQRKIQLICVQYPMQSVRLLKDIFIGEGGQGIIFVDNERIFKEAVRVGGYKTYFADMFGGNFGHSTEKGNELLAGNIASVILGEVFTNK